MAGGVWPGPAASWLAGIRLLRDFEAPAFARVSGPVKPLLRHSAVSEAIRRISSRTWAAGSPGVG